MQIDLLAEYEITRLLALVDAIAKKLDVSAGDDGELAELMVCLKPEELLQELEEGAKNGMAVAKPA